MNSPSDRPPFLRPLPPRPRLRRPVAVLRLAAAVVAAAALYGGARSLLFWREAMGNQAMLADFAMEDGPFPGFIGFFLMHGFYLAALVYWVVMLTAAVGLWRLSKGAWRTVLLLCALALATPLWTFLMHGPARLADTGTGWWVVFFTGIFALAGVLLSGPARRVLAGPRPSFGRRLFWRGAMVLALAAVLTGPAVLVGWKIHIANTADEPFWAWRRPITRLVEPVDPGPPDGWKQARYFGYTFPAPETGTLLRFPLTEEDEEFGMLVILVENPPSRSLMILSQFTPAGLAGFYEGYGVRDGIDLLCLAYASNWSLMPMIARHALGGDGNPDAYFWESADTKAFARVAVEENGRGRVQLDLYFKESGIHRDVHFSGIPAAETETGLASILSSIRWGEESRGAFAETGLPGQLELLRRYRRNDLEAGVDLAEKMWDDGRARPREAERLVEDILRHDPGNERALRLRELIQRD